MRAPGEFARPTRRSVLGALSSAPWIAGCSRAGRSGRTGRGVLMVVVDALRYDLTTFAALPAGGGPTPAGVHDTTPRLYAWAQKEAVVLDDFWSASPSLVPSHVALLTGCDPMVARTPRVILTDGRIVEPLTPWTIPRGVPTLAEEFLKEGWSTAAFMDHRFPVLGGLERGFLDFESFGGSERKRLEPGLAGVCLRFLEWIEGLDREQDWFAYLHLNDLEVVWSEDEWLRTRHPELALGPLRADLDFVPTPSANAPVFHSIPQDRVLRGQPTLATYLARYEAALSWMDGNLVRLFDTLSALGRLERTTVAVTGSFGLSFGESGLVVASGSPCDVDLHVPCILRAAPELRLAPGARHAGLASSLDLPQTLLQLAELPVPAGMHGTTLVPYLRGRAPAARETAFASHGELGGFCAVDEERVYTVLAFGNRKGPTVRSWFGDDRRHPQEERFLLHRGPAGRPDRGLEWPSQGEEDIAPDLHAAARAWYEDLERAREVLHPSAWNVDKRGAAVVAELREKGLLGG